MRLQIETMRSLLAKIFSRENGWALALCLILILLVIFTADSAPLWIYQGF
ncbi:MAG: hypothetical protein AB9891_01045 [Anaerolineaceae bacterium]